MFIKIVDIPAYIYAVTSIEANQDMLGLLIELRIIPRYGDACLLSDVERWLAAIVDRRPQAYTGGDLFSHGRLSSIPVAGIGEVEVPGDIANVDPGFFAGINNLAIKGAAIPGDNGREFSCSYYSSAKLRYNEKAQALIYAQRARRDRLLVAQSGRFANSAYYMGSKKALSGFLVEALSSFMKDDDILVDLMAGSGAASGAFCKSWHTLASDVQRFSLALATVQGGGMTVDRAKGIVDAIHGHAARHALELLKEYESFVRREDAIFHGDLSDDVLKEFVDLLKTYPSYRGDETISHATIEAVAQRRKMPTGVPYVLFTLYFANIYFGIRQSIEIDSIRYAIDQLDDAQSREWALGALIATVSAVATSYGGHFAQPLITPSTLTISKLRSIVEKRAISVMHEFAIRLINLAEESENTRFEVEAVEGPWKIALKAVKNRIKGKRAVIYIDAPYTRDEYSRYYHVLETLARYNYPTIEGKGLVPSKKSGERFASEFFTRDKARLERVFSEMFEEILQEGWSIAWSYADSGLAEMTTVIEAVAKRIRSDVRSYSLPYTYKPQGGRAAKQVTEYLVLISPAR